jgi:succinyl-CoA synthetase beta subunit
VDALSFSLVFVTFSFLTMRLIEKDAKELLKRQGILVPAGFFLDWSVIAWPLERSWTGPLYLKAQVLAGRRGKGGLVQRVATKEEFNRVLTDLRAQLSEATCAGFWCEEELIHDAEWFVSCDIDRATGEIRHHVSQAGGKEVSVVQSFTIQALNTAGNPLNLPPGITTLVQSLQSILVSSDALSIEINPCVLNTAGDAIALDAKIELDEAASFRHPEWQELSPLSRYGSVASSREQAYMDLLTQTNRPLLGKYVELSGTIAVILAGGGASLVAMDALARAGGKAANYLELSGNPDPTFLHQAAMIAFSRPQIEAIWIAGSFANFTDIDVTVRAILQAVEDTGIRVPVIIRRDGPNADAAETAAHAWAIRTGIPLLFQRGSVDLTDSADALVRLLPTIL